MIKLWNPITQLTPLDIYLSNCVTISNYTSSYILNGLVLEKFAIWVRVCLSVMNILSHLILCAIFEQNIIKCKAKCLLLKIWNCNIVICTKHVQKMCWGIHTYECMWYCASIVKATKFCPAKQITLRVERPITDHKPITNSFGKNFSILLHFWMI